MVNRWIEKFFHSIGVFVSTYPIIIIILTLLFVLLCNIGFNKFEIETNIYELWTPTNSPVFDEREFVDKYWRDRNYGLAVISAVAKEDWKNADVMEEKYLDEWFKFHLDLYTTLPKLQYLKDGANLTFSYFPSKFHEPGSATILAAKAALGLKAPGFTSDVIPFCRPLALSPFEAQFQVPCYIFSLFDCFTEGGYFFPYENYIQKTFLTALVPANPYTFARPSFKGKEKFDLGVIFGPSCRLWNNNTIPSNYLFGGIQRLNNSDIFSPMTKIQSYQTVLFVDSDFGVARKIKIGKGECKITSTLALDCPEITKDELNDAADFLDEYLSKYIDFMKDYSKKQADDSTKLLNIQFWTPRSASDLLKEASQADFFLLALAYICMIVFASAVAMRPNDWFLSRSEASFFGVILVLLSVLGTIGLGSAFVVISPNIIQVLPFIALGFGVDDMFVLLFAFKYRERATIQEMISETVRVAGSSVALTSLANLFSFIIGTQMPLPDVANFALFGVIIVLINFITVIFGFTAVLTLVAKRMRSHYIDWSFLFCFADFTKATKFSSEKHAADDKSVFDPLFDWLTKTPTRIVMTLCFVALIIVGGVGTSQMEAGLPLADITPEDHYANDFLTVRERFYSTYVVGLYTDAKGKSLRPIDWPNKFELWINKTRDDIYSISDVVYGDEKVQDFWAWDLQDYLRTKYYNSLLPNYTLGVTFTQSSTVYYHSRDCNSDRIKFCPAFPVIYNQQSNLYKCLMANKASLTSTCSGYLNNITAPIPRPAFAQQIFVISEETSNLDIQGLYLRNSDDTQFIYWKYPLRDGYIYRNPKDCDASGDYCKWYLLNKNFELVYIGDSTPDDAAMPAQGGWTDPNTGDRVQVYHTFWNLIVFVLKLYRKTGTFIPINPTFLANIAYNNPFLKASTNKPGCYQFDITKLLLKAATTGTFIDFTMGSTVSTGNSSSLSSAIVCPAVIESTELCRSIRDESSLGTKVCGASAESGSTTNKEYEYYTGSCMLDNTTSKFTIASAPTADTTNYQLDSSIACNCANTSAWNRASWNNGDNSVGITYLTPCGGNKFGGSDIRINETGTANTCNARDETLSFSCSAFTDCNSIKICYEDFVKLSQTSSSSFCRTQRLETFDYDDRNGFNSATNYQQIDVCLIGHYSDVSYCCQQALQKNIFPLESCSRLESIFDVLSSSDSTREVACNILDRCQYTSGASTTCQASCTNSSWVDCSDIISNSVCSGTVGNQDLFYNCITNNASQSSNPCCSTAAAVESSKTKCLKPPATYWDFSLSEPAYNIAPYCTGGELTSAGCTGSPMACNSTLLTTQCCKEAVQSIQAANSYIFTKECEGDSQYYCNGKTTVHVNATLCLAKQNALNKLSPKCKDSLKFCSMDGVWPLTEGGKTASIICDKSKGLIGSRTRLCDNSTGIAMWSATVDESQCRNATCPAISRTSPDFAKWQQIFPATTVNDIATVQGGLIPGLSGMDGSQVSDKLIEKIKNETGFTQATCNPVVGANAFYVRRKCKIGNAPDYNATWDEPVGECRPFYGRWTTKYNETTCDVLTEQALKALSGAGLPIPNIIKKANLIDVLPWAVYAVRVNKGVMPTPDQQLGLSRSRCSSQLTKCAAFTYDSFEQTTYFFDYCPTINKQQLFAGFVEGTETAATALKAANTSGFSPLWPAIPWQFPSLKNSKGVPLYKFADNKTTYVAPLELSQFTAQYCSAKSAGIVQTTGNATKFVRPVQAWNWKGIPNPLCFNNTLWQYHLDPTGGALYKDKILFNDSSKITQATAFDEVTIVSTYNAFTVVGITDDEAAVDFINDLRDRIDNDWEKDGFYVIPSGLVIELFSQYIGVEGYLVTNLAYVAIAVILTGFVFLLNPIAVFVALLCNAAMIIEVYGFAAFASLKINGVLVLNIVIAIGLTMEFTAHMARAFVLTQCNENDKRGSIALPFANEGQIRMKKTLREMFTPVTLGALTTLLGVAPIAAANFPYFRQYYFTLYVLIVLFGWLNGVIFQPILLSWYPPAPFIMEPNGNMWKSMSSMSKQTNDDIMSNDNDNDVENPQNENQKLVEGNNTSVVPQRPKSDRP